jgi:hypothetical protein
MTRIKCLQSHTRKHKGVPLLTHPRKSTIQLLPKSPKSQRPQPILFAIQCKFSNSPKYTNVQLVTLFPVQLRVLPFSDDSSKNPRSQTQSKTHPIGPFYLASSQSLIKGLRPDLILFVIRFNVTHLLIPFFIQDPFSHKFLKLS